MDQKTENPVIEWVRIKDTDCLKFTFTGILNADEADIAIAIWRQEFASRKGEKTVIIWNCIKMLDYEPKARVKWQNTMKELKDQIASIWLVTDSLIIKTGAAIMGIFTSLDINVVSSEDKVLAKK